MGKLGVIFACVFLIFLICLVTATPSFIPGSVRTQMNLSEDLSPLYTYNFSNNITRSEDDTLPFTFSLKNITSNMHPDQTLPSFYSWFSMNSSSGILTINATTDNQTGRFNTTIEVSNNNLPPSGVFDIFYFVINSTNDYPIFTSISNEYNFSEGNLSQYYLNASDEENQYPLRFNVSFVNCSLSGFSTKTNCSLFNVINFSNTSSMINITPTSNDVGVYYANISVMDAASNFNTCASGYCAPDYFVNKTTYYSQLVAFNVFSNILINATNCQNKVFQKGSLGTCNITIYSKGPSDSLNISSYAFLRNSNNNVSNRTWFYPANLSNAGNFVKNITINVYPNITEIGNWTINFSVDDLTYGLLVVEPINIIVNRTSNSLPDILNISEITTSIDLLTVINLTASDDDFLIPDKDRNLGGFNESLSFIVDIFNRSNPIQKFNLTNFYPVIQNMPVPGTNRTIAYISFTLNSSEVGNYTVNITIRDFENATDTTLFNLTVLRNSAPQWVSITNSFVYYEGNNTYINLSSNVSDPDGDLMTFSYVSDNSFSSFSINATTGIINFTNKDEDVGQHLVSIISTDRLGLSSNVTINFTIYNVNEAPYIRPIIQSYVDNCTVYNGNNLTCNEKDSIRIRIWTEDDDFKILSGQKSFYDENLTLRLNITGPNSSLFSFNNFLYPPNAGSNLSIFGASFVPGKNDVGNYNISLNISDNSGRSALVEFNLSISVFEDAPVLDSLNNQTTAISRNLVYQINASDDENGYSNITGGNSNFTFNYTFLNGLDFINYNVSIFNTTTGLLNYTFNSSQGGIYKLNITVRDSTNRLDSRVFWINVYDTPNVTFPLINYAFSLSENTSQNLTFRTNHSIGNNLTYILTSYNWNNTEIRIYNASYFGNNSNLTFVFSPDFNNETNGIKNITLVVYPSDSNLINANEVNSTRIWNLTIYHTNFPLTNLSIPIGGVNRIISGSSPRSYNLDSFFYDFDAIDPLHNQTIYFNYTALTGGCPMGVSLSNWVNRTGPSINFSATTTSSCNFSVTGFEYNESNTSQILTVLQSNNFSVDLTIEAQIITQIVTQTSSSSRIVSLKIITPGLVSVFPFETIRVPITIENNGQYAMNSIDLSHFVFRDKISTNLVDVSFSENTISTLSLGEKKNITLIISPKTSEIGYYDVTLNANVSSPKYTALGHVYFSIGKANDSEIKKYLLFAEEFLTQNKECSELKEYIKVAYDYYNKDQFGDARLKAEEAVNSCKNRLASEKNIVNLINPKENFVVYFAGSVLLGFILGIGYYLVKRHRLKRGETIKIYED